MAGPLWAVRWLDAMLFGVSARDPWLVASARAMLLAIALVAAWIPARRAARIDPMALRRD